MILTDTHPQFRMPLLLELIKGNLGTRIYHVNLAGFDTHSNQLSRHTGLLDNLSQSVEAFLSDMNVGDQAEDVLVMTFSEFGRRISQNGSAGTDHGTAAPLFLFGKGVTGGLYGEMPALDDVDRSGNMKYSSDFRSVYATVLNKWFGVPEEDVTEVFGAAFETIPFIDNPSTVGAEDSPTVPKSFALEQNYPNPFNPTTRISFSLDQAGPAQLDVYDVAGRKVRSIIDANLSAGRHEYEFRADGLASGTYLYRLKTLSGTLSRQMTLLR